MKTELEVSDAGILRESLKAWEVSGWFRYEKYGPPFICQIQNVGRGLLIELDETPIGAFVELEGPAEAIDRTATELGFQK